MSKQTSSSPFVQEPHIPHRSHPLHLVTDRDISRGSAVVKNALKGANTSIRFKNISLHEPPKALLLPYLDAKAKGVSISDRPFVPRCLTVIWSPDNERRVTESIVSLDSNSLAGHTDSTRTARFETKQASDKILSDPEVRKAIRNLKLPDDVIV